MNVKSEDLGFLIFALTLICFLGWFLFYVLGNAVKSRNSSSDASSTFLGEFDAMHSISNFGEIVNNHNQNMISATTSYTPLTSNLGSVQQNQVLNRIANLVMQRLNNESLSEISSLDNRASEERLVKSVSAQMEAHNLSLSVNKSELIISSTNIPLNLSSDLKKKEIYLLSSYCHECREQFEVYSDSISLSASHCPLCKTKEIYWIIKDKFLLSDILIANSISNSINNSDKKDKWEFVETDENKGGDK